MLFHVSHIPPTHTPARSCRCPRPGDWGWAGRRPCGERGPAWSSQTPAGSSAHSWKWCGSPSSLPGGGDTRHTERRLTLGPQGDTSPHTPQSGWIENNLVLIKKEQEWLIPRLNKSITLLRVKFWFGKQYWSKQLYPKCFALLLDTHSTKWLRLDILLQGGDV